MNIKKLLYFAPPKITARVIALVLALILALASARIAHGLINNEDGTKSEIPSVNGQVNVEKENEEDKAPEGYKSVRVELGINDEDYIEIKSGLKEGDELKGITAQGNDFMQMMPGMGGMPGGGMGGPPMGGGMPGGANRGGAADGNRGGAAGGANRGGMGGGMR